jgi:hypothetical protein
VAFPWTDSHHVEGDLREGVQRLKDATAAGHAGPNCSRRNRCATARWPCTTAGPGEDGPAEVVDQRLDRLGLVVAV